MSSLWGKVLSALRDPYAADSVQYLALAAADIALKHNPAATPDDVRAIATEEFGINFPPHTAETALTTRRKTLNNENN